MAHVNDFIFGWFTPLIAYGASVMGSLLGLLCTVRAREFRSTGGHARWLVLASVAIGGTGIWLMHFSAMIGFGVDGSEVRYDVTLTILSALVAVLVVGCGLFVVGYGRPLTIKILIGGLFTGLGVGGMHYMGMAAMRVDGEIHYDIPLVIASLLIAIVAATVALWFTVSLRSRPAVLAGALVMGVAVCGMHYTGMAALSVRLKPGAQTLSGVDPLQFMLPVIIAALIALAMLLLAVITGPTREDMEVRAQLFATPAPHPMAPSPARAAGQGSHRLR